MEATTPTTPAQVPATPTPAKSWGHMILLVSIIALGFMAWNTWNTQRENQKLALQNVLYQAEHRILKSEIYEKDRALDSRPTYEQGYKDALVRVGGPQTPGAYQDGWDDAMKIYGTDNGYADGYHAAIKQFGYTKTTAMTRWLIPEPKIGTEKDKSVQWPIGPSKDGVPTKAEKK